MTLLKSPCRHDEWQGIAKEPPVPPQHGGQMHPTDFKLVKVNQPAGKCYSAGGNLAWVSPFWAPASVPLICSAIQMLVNGKFCQPVPLEITVMVNSVSDPTSQQQRIQSGLKRLSPEEEHLAYILATWRDVSQGLLIEDWLFLILFLFGQSANRQWLKLHLFNLLRLSKYVNDVVK